MDRVRGVGLTVAGFVVAIMLTTLLVRIDPASELPGLTQAAPREIPVAVVGGEPQATTMRDALNGPVDQPLAARLSPSRKAAAASLQHRSVSGVLLLGRGDRHVLWVASAAGTAEAAEVRATVEEILAVSGQTVRVVDRIPTSARDPHGVGPFRLGMGWALLGVAFAGLLGLVFGARSAGPRLVLLRFAGLAGGAAVAGVGGAFLSDVLIDRFDAPFWPLAGLGALVVLGVGAVTLALIAWFGGLGLGLAILGLVLGIPGAIGAWPLTPMPVVWPTLLAWLPPGAATWGIRGLAYFDGDGGERVVLMFMLWTMIGLAVTTVAATEAESRPGLLSVHPSLRRRPVVAALGALFLAGVLVVTPAAPAFTTSAPQPSVTVTCTPVTLPRNVEELNQRVETVDDIAGFVGGDVGASTALVDGRELFVFGDTVRRPDYDRTTRVRNSMLVLGDGCAGLVQRRNRGALIPDRPDGVGYWPMSIAAVELDGHDLVGVMAQRVEQTGDDGLFAFRNLGPAVAIFDVESGQGPVLQRVVDLGKDDPDPSRPTWGAAGAIVGDTVYLYGTSRSSENGFGWAVSVARATLTDITDQSTWRYWDGSRWQRDEDRAATLIDQQDGVSQTFSVFREGDSWYALSKQSDFVGTDLVLWKAPSPTGPFTALPPVAKIPSTSSELRYMPLAHPDLFPEPGTMVVSVSRNTTDGDVQADPSLYRPEFLRIDLP
ncbi:DUF4185 domain-containing protein [Aeromicrobium duanguangcaii]|uniref:DUF4185 domain-containing protein n=1 Tax=Aeromicrobium duanguangcaii TaxID=2968086 RepID=UPI002017B874|nr:DUF4185 domain-containing protein [Aeromicrobium duanguangcaii]MCL3838620.1 DUF4185 domain-containing protein [Aeromicrobium duanguangcaii]